MAYTLTADLHYGAGSTGLTLAAVFRNRDGTPNEAGSAAFTEVEGGDYEATLTVPDGFQGWVRFSSAGGTVARGTLAINPPAAVGAESSDPWDVVLPGLYTAGQAGYLLAVLAAGGGGGGGGGDVLPDLIPLEDRMILPAQVDLTVITGSTFTWDATFTVAAALFDWTGYTAELQIRHVTGDPAPVITLTVGAGIELGGATGTLHWELSATQTGLLFAHSQYVYEMKIQSGPTGPKNTLMFGTLQIQRAVVRTP